MCFVKVILLIKQFLPFTFIIFFTCWRRAFERRLDSALKRPANRGCVAPGILLDSALKRPAAILLHETAVSWLRKRLEQSTPKKCWEETREAYGRRLKRCCDDINKDCDVEGLCRGFPKRIKLLADSGGDCLPCKTLRVACNRIMKCCDLADSGGDRAKHYESLVVR